MHRVQGGPRDLSSPPGSLEEENEVIPEPLTPNPSHGVGVWREDISHQGPQGPHSHFLTHCPGPWEGMTGTEPQTRSLLHHQASHTGPPGCQMLVTPLSTLRCKRHELPGMTAQWQVKAPCVNEREQFVLSWGPAGAASLEQGHKGSPLAVGTKASTCHEAGCTCLVGP